MDQNPPLPAFNVYDYKFGSPQIEDEGQGYSRVGGKARIGGGIFDIGIEGFSYFSDTASVYTISIITKIRVQTLPSGTSTLIQVAARRSIILNINSDGELVIKDGNLVNLFFSGLYILANEEKILKLTFTRSSAELSTGSFSIQLGESMPKGTLYDISNIPENLLAKDNYYTVTFISQQGFVYDLSFITSGKGSGFLRGAPASTGAFNRPCFGPDNATNQCAAELGLIQEQFCVECTGTVWILENDMKKEWKCASGGGPGHLIQRSGTTIFTNVFLPCPSGQYKNGGSCSPCPQADCHACTGPNAPDCISCDEAAGGEPQTRNMANNTCNVCDGVDLTFWEPTAECINYGTNCSYLNCSAGCDDTLECVDCDPGHIWQNGACVSATSGNTFQYTSGGTPAEVPCHGNCQECFNDTPFGCTVCPSTGTTEYNAKYNYCWDPTSCSANQIWNPLTSSCENCPAGCSECYSANVGECTACIDTNPPTNGVCSSCHSTCLTCNTPSETDCVTCNPAENRYFVGATKTCPVCPSGEYTTDGISCTACDAPCTQCQESGNTNCSACASTHWLDGQVCSICDNTCLTCNGGTATHCVTCDTAANRYKDGSQCLLCTGNTYSTGTSCGACDSECNGCTAPGANNCITCADGYYDNGGTCTQCDNTCVTCSGGASNQCASCDTAAGRYLSGGACHICAQDTYSTGPGCANCVSPCDRCTGPANGQCITCAAGFAPNEGVNANECLACNGCQTCTTNPNTCATCVDGKFLTGGNTCDDCTSPCSKCSGTATNCEECIVGKFLVGNACSDCPTGCTECSSAVVCTDCDGGYYLNNNSCLVCDTGCTACSGTSNNCSACTGGYFLEASKCKLCSENNCNACQMNGDCDNCLPGFYHTGGTSQCLGCPLDCNSCTGPNQCTTCKAGKHYDSALNQCIDCDVLQAGRFIQGNDCLFCDDTNCIDCTSNTPDKTLCAGSCKANFYRSTPTAECVNCDPNGNVITGTHPNQACESCPLECQTCSDRSTCIQCNPGWLVGSDGNCYNCQSSEFLTPTNNCQACSSSCVSCEQNANDCTACPSGMVVTGVSGSRTCVAEFSPGCDTSCATCDSTFPTQCKTCPSGKCFNNAQKCVDCPTETFTPLPDTNENIVQRSVLTYNLFQFDINDPKVYKLTFSEQEVVFLDPITIDNISSYIRVSHIFL